MKVVISVEGMTCNHCASSVQRALEDFPNVQDVYVDLQASKAEVTGLDMDVPAMCRAVSNLGYKAQTANP